jgi:hypothetical protein
MRHGRRLQITAMSLIQLHGEQPRPFIPALLASAVPGWGAIINMLYKLRQKRKK